MMPDRIDFRETFEYKAALNNLSRPTKARKNRGEGGLSSVLSCRDNDLRRRGRIC